jgi:hypothetical protein
MNMKFSETPPKGGASDYLSLKDKESVKGFFRGEPKGFMAEFNGKEKWRFQVNFVTRDDKGDLRVVVWEQGAQTYDQLKALNEACEGRLEDTCVLVQRHGEKLDTFYQIIPMNPQPDLKVLEAVTKIELKALPYKPEKKGESGDRPDWDGVPAPQKFAESNVGF